MLIIILTYDFGYTKMPNIFLSNTLESQNEKTVTERICLRRNGVFLEKLMEESRCDANFVLNNATAEEPPEQSGSLDRFHRSYVSQGHPVYRIVTSTAIEQ